MTASIFQLSDKGAPLRLAVKKRSDGSWETDLGSATARTISMRSPSGVLKTFAAVVEEVYKLVYYFTSADLNEWGRWKAQGGFTLGSLVVHTDVVTIDVRKNV